jgi:phosphopantetheinyl transferase
VAIAAEDRDGIGVGIDVQRYGRTAAGFEDVAFTMEERRHLMGLEDQARGEWTLRMWCAKEAAGKALGSGLPGGPRDALVRAVDELGGTVDVAPSGALVRQHPEVAGRIMDVFTSRQDDLVLALSIYSKGNGSTRGAVHGD